MKAAKYNFQWIDSTPLASWMKRHNVVTFHVEVVEGIRFAISPCGYGIMIASTVPGLCGDLQVTTVTNKRYKEYPGEYLLIIWAPYANRR